MRKLLLALAIIAAPWCAAQADEWVVEAHYPDQAALIRASSKFQHVDVDAARQVLRVDTDEAGIAVLEEAGLEVRIDVAATAELRAFLATMREAIDSGERQLTGGGYPGIPGFACYRTVEGAYQTMDDLVAAHPQFAEVHEIGPTWMKAQNPSNGYEMRALRITNLATAADEPERPVFVAFGSIHAREYTPAELLTRMAEWLIAGYGTDPQATWLVDHVDFRLVLLANPDGRKKAEQGTLWRKNRNSVDGACSWQNYVGIDLNRNFPFHWHTTGEQGSSSDRCDETFRGPSAGSEPETQNLVRYVAGDLGAGGIHQGGVLPDRRADDTTTPAPEDYSGLFFDIHSYSRLVLWSWGDTYSLSPNDTALRTLGRRLAWFNGYAPQAAIELYPTDGTTDDTFYGLLGAPSYTIELGRNFFESCSVFESETFPLNFAALKYAARTTAEPYRLPAGPDAYDITASAAMEGAGGWYTTVSATVSDTRYSTVNGTQATFAITGANAFIDILPWAPGAVPIPLAASDGAFDGKTEVVAENISLAGLAPGRHIVYVQGVNALDGGTPGAPDAIFIDVPTASEATVTTAVMGAGSVDPSAAQTVPVGTVLSFELTPAVGQHIAGVTGCGGSLAAATYTTAPVNADCTVVATFAPDQYRIGGNVSGLAASGLVLRLNGGADVAITPPATGFEFPGTLSWGASYEVTIAAQPEGELCVIGNGSGIVEGDVDDIAVSCADDTIFEDGFDG
ncbi:MAG: hypothetical protein J0H15_07745 [Xanthomonadales bacterium]|nr:hypothetical protein [Xanthomonadales bacterium]